MGSASSKAAEAGLSQSQLSEKTLAVVQDDLSEPFEALDLAGEAVPLSEEGAITLRHLTNWEYKIFRNDKLQLTRTILTHTDIPTALASRSAKVSDPHVFNLALSFKTDPITSQNSSGRCWLFATTNVLRYSVMKKLGLKEFQLSQSYLFIYDKLQKANYYLELSIQNANLPLDDRRVSFAAQSPVGDGGQWDMACNLMETYGVVPRDIYPESFSSGSSAALNRLVTTKLREHALILRRLSLKLRDSGQLSERDALRVLRAKKEVLMAEIWTLVSTTLGAPPRPDRKFTWEYLDSNEKAHTWTGTPIEFFKAFTDKRYPPTESFSLLNDPRNEYGKLYTVQALGNIWGARPVLCMLLISPKPLDIADTEHSVDVNTESDRLKAAVIKCINAGLPVFFGCDVGKSSERNAGLMDTNMYEYENAFNLKFGMTKADRLETGESAMTHAMVISAVHIDEKTKKPIRYKVENSWGPDVGNKGYFVMTDKWFDEYVYQVVIPKTLADKDLLEVFEKGEKVELPPWDPMVRLKLRI